MARLARAVARLTAPPTGVTEGLLWALFDTLSTVEEVTWLAGQAVCVACAVCAWCGTEQTHIPASVLVGTLRAMPATLVSEKKVTFNTAVADLRVFYRACSAAHLTVNALSSVGVLHLPFVTGRSLAHPILKLVVFPTFSAYVPVRAQFTVGYAGQADIVTPVGIKSPGAVCPTATLVKKTFLSIFINSTGSAIKQLMPVALRAGGMTEDTLTLQQKLSARTGRRGFTHNKSNTVDKDQKRG